MAYEDGFESAGYDWRLYCGEGVIENNLKSAAQRLGASRAMVICSPSINSKTNTIARIEAALGDLYAGVFDQIEKDSTYQSVCGAVDAAKTAGADLLIAVGGGSVIVSTRAVAIFLAETASPFEIMTQYPEGGRPFSPRLMAPKLPIINIPTTPTSAMNRAGTGLKNTDLDHRMEYFDPKTRPRALFFDYETLLTTPPGVIRSTATTVFSGLISSSSREASNPLIAGNQAQAFKLGFNAYKRLMNELDNPVLRRDLCLSAFLSNRSEDDGRARVMVGNNYFGGNYAVATALHLYRSNIGQGESTCVLHASNIRLAKPAPLEAAQRTASVLGVWQDGMMAGEATEAIASELENIYTNAGMPIRLRELDLEQEDLPKIAAETVKNFNARGSFTSPEERIATSLKLLEAAY